MSRLRRLMSAALCALAATLIVGLAWVDRPSHGSLVSSTDDVSLGRQLFNQGCASCHGMSAEGVEGRGPSLAGVGAMAADFYLSTGRMPLSAPGQTPHRAHPAYPRSQIRALVDYIASLGGPAIPSVDPGSGSLDLGERLFAGSCAGCHQITAVGGVVPGASVPALDDASPTQIAEAIRIGPNLMPRFGAHELSRHDVDSIAQYVMAVRTRPDNRGGWSLGNLGPVSEGMVAWLIALTGLVAVARITGRRE